MSRSVPFLISIVSCTQSVLSAHALSLSYSYPDLNASQSVTVLKLIFVHMVNDKIYDTVNNPNGEFPRNANKS